MADSLQALLLQKQKKKETTKALRDHYETEIKPKIKTINQLPKEERTRLRDLVKTYNQEKDICNKEMGEINEKIKAAEASAKKAGECRLSLLLFY